MTITMEKAAKLDFEPWPCDQPILSNEEWINPHLVNIRMAYRVMSFTKAELQEKWQQSGDTLIDLHDRIVETQKALHAVSALLSSAEWRLLVSGSAASVEEGE